MTDKRSDRDFADNAFGHLPRTASSPAFEAALLAAYDAWSAERAKGFWAAWNAGLRRFFEAVWPGAPLWAPASALVAALLVGAGLGATLPAVTPAEQPGFSLEQPESFNLFASEGTQEEEL
ncbi:MAG: hypothetical protein ABI191_08265 [Rhizomicrobium sp.]